MNELQDTELVLVKVNTHNEEQGGISPVDNLVVLVLHKGGLKISNGQSHVWRTWVSDRERHLRMISPSIAMRSSRSWCT